MIRGVLRSRRQAASHADFWAAARDALRPQALTFAVLGDSAAQGVGVEDPRQGYVGTLSERLRALTGAEVDVVNLSVSGAHIADVVRDQLPRLAYLDREPDVITCVIGGNDVAAVRRWFRIDDFRRDADAIAQALPRHAVLGSVPSFGPLPNNRWARRATDVQRTVATRYGLGFADLFTPTQATWPWPGPTLLSGDWFHPNARGYRVWADALWPRIQDVALARTR
ncbi:SGNH/GDSL hydrolase family protein [Kribbia dieselivorans]|uniref:SGNH/GDSL hydrolase family protein n=1 Tax=Kribbia dieselivorans TaxID=331526 RepID=UPI000837CA96|nr:SGNH/GDSL hydrolase family protein [Kribbia dieselivorans]